jgi:hypothetical protein
MDRVQYCRSYREKKPFIRARYVINHSLVGIISPKIQVQVAEEKYIIVNCVSHRSPIIVVQSDDSEVVYVRFHAMYVRKFSLVALSRQTYQSTHWSTIHFVRSF